MAKKLVTVDGISVKLDPEILDDWNVGKLSVKASRPLPDKNDPDFQKVLYDIGDATIELFEFVLGEQADAVIKAFRKKNGGYANQEKVFKWFRKLQDKVTELKN